MRTTVSNIAGGDAGSQNPIPVEVSPVAWAPKIPLPLAEWIRYGARFGVVGRACGWWVGDWINYGNAAYGEKYSRAARITRHDIQTLMNMAYVASRFEISRRRENLSWSHHAELAALPPEAQDRWLDRIERHALTVKDLRLELRRDRSARHKADPAQDAAPQFALPLDTAADGHQVECPKCGYVYGA